MHMMSNDGRMPMQNQNPMAPMGGPQQMRPPQVDASKVQKQTSSKDNNTPGPKKSKTQKEQQPKPKKEGPTKSPTVKRPKEIQYSRLLFIQHYFNGTELTEASDEKDDAPAEPIPDDDQEKNDDAADKPDQEQPEADKDEKDQQDPNQIDSSGMQKLEDTTAVDERGEEFHDHHIGSDQGDEAALVNPYEDDEPMMLEINSKSKAKCLKKVILEKKSLEGSQLLLFK